MKKSKRFVAVAGVFAVWILTPLVSVDAFLRLAWLVIPLVGLYLVCETYRQSGMEEKAIDAALGKLHEIEHGGKVR